MSRIPARRIYNLLDPVLGRRALHASPRIFSSGTDFVEGYVDNFVKHFRDSQDIFDVQRNLNNCFAYDIVPPPPVLAEALHAARRVNDYPLAVRIFEGLSYKVENKRQFDEYVETLLPICKELGLGDNQELEYARK